MSTILELQDRYLVVADSQMEKTIALATKAARTDAPVLIIGESGTGKELIARYIHERSARRLQPFLSVNCAAIPDGLIEAELFGFEKGAFTGALQQRIGKFERASQGTFLLDEISEMPLHLQAKLLRVLQEGEIDRIGGATGVRVHTRVLATTNMDPADWVLSGKFRADLFYRLNVLRIVCPPLRGRKEAIAALAEVFTRRSSYGALFDHAPQLTTQAIEKLCAYNWPGNIRELQNTIERALVNSDTHRIGPEWIEFSEALSKEKAVGEDLSVLERGHILRVLDSTEGNRSEAARRLGISVRTLRNKLKIYGEA